MQMRSEVATMKLVLERTSIPLPSVFGFECQDDNQFGFPYMFMSALPGRTLDKTFALSVPEQHKPKVASQLARYWYELSLVTFDEIGRLYSGLEADHPHIVSLLWYGAHRREPGPHEVGPFKTSGAYFSGIRQGMNDLLRAQHRDDGSQWSKPCQALADVVPSLILSSQRRRGPFPLSHPDLHHGNVLVDDDYNVTGVIDWTNAHTVPVEVFAAWREIMIPGSAPNDTKEAIAQFRDLLTKALKNLESATESGSTDSTMSDLLESSLLAGVHRWLFAVQRVPHTLRAASVYAEMILRDLYGDEATVANCKSILKKKQKRTTVRNPRPTSQ